MTVDQHKLTVEFPIFGVKDLVSAVITSCRRTKTNLPRDHAYVILNYSWDRGYKAGVSQILRQAAALECPKVWVMASCVFRDKKQKIACLEQAIKSGSNDSRVITKLVSLYEKTIRMGDASETETICIGRSSMSEIKYIHCVHQDLVFWAARVLKHFPSMCRELDRCLQLRFVVDVQNFLDVEELLNDIDHSVVVFTPKEKDWLVLFLCQWSEKIAAGIENIRIESEKSGEAKRSDMKANMEAKTISDEAVIRRLLESVLKLIENYDPIIMYHKELAARQNWFTALWIIDKALCLFPFRRTSYIYMEILIDDLRRRQNLIVWRQISYWKLEKPLVIVVSILFENKHFEMGNEMFKLCMFKLCIQPSVKQEVTNSQLLEWWKLLFDSFVLQSVDSSEEQIKTLEEFPTVLKIWDSRIAKLSENKESFEK